MEDGAMDLTAASFIRLEDPLTWPAAWCWCIGSCPHEPGHVWASQKDAYVSSWLSGWPSPEWAIWERKRKHTRGRYHFYDLVLWSNSYQIHIVSVQFSHSVMSDFLWPPWTTARQASLSITNSRSLLKLMSILLVISSKHFILCHPLSSHLQSFPASGSFLMRWFFVSGGQRIGVSASASVLPMNIQDWFPLGWTGWISLQLKALSRVFCNTTSQNHQFFSAQRSS